MGIYFVSPQAAQDLQEIHDYLFVKNPDTANKFLDAMAQKFEILANFPNMGRRRDELSPILRSFPVDDYLIFYRPIADGIEITRVVSGYRDLDALFDQES
ncbi:type II toxin-antitoxin system RelE/ParE family toxin [Scytonema hofmannii FACHB-248]|uniref:Type II toxin-antitoxin system RelE/ParE family toxin n=1 Tax=Scytonema hofmannii FACHB-248 TaxID=1842502 RepID=A0ABR8H2D7_9CYAN|nr:MULTISPECIES: type II toxin-antitoxin system RelE/ParE family toxin [Nostocales]MBD2609178.1 type II toxin-antitoxin system RelE/ParE family toxin [Scytonema hofmannii FACHB-248]